MSKKASDQGPQPLEYFKLDDEQREMVKAWEQLLPPMIARKHVEWFTGGVLKRQRLAAADSDGTGPVDPLRIGRCICYWTRHLLVWMVQDRGVTQMQTLSASFESKGLERSKSGLPEEEKETPSYIKEHIEYRERGRA